MPNVYPSKHAFLQEGTHPLTTYRHVDSLCPICHDHIPTPEDLHPALRRRRKATRLPFPDDQPIPPYVSSPDFCENHMRKIKRCGHCFCYDCLNTWLRESPTCPMCRARLFWIKRRGVERDIREGELVALIERRERMVARKWFWGAVKALWGMLTGRRRRRVERVVVVAREM
ncbi:Peroxisome biogenesis factor 10 [Pyrenophora seminiperda CCB06]|uniref:Peroxisome biogenesis factor 10 n=1 Tax=Pyrenophora seminiperda CCB06 TaxID=1302712 RepID=A0A3M7LZL2_9PLEO|nr:Peroxisome biogenesis factor 10 [Pyrenophora seminiperda CCB06]